MTNNSSEKDSVYSWILDYGWVILALSIAIGINYTSWSNNVCLEKALCDSINETYNSGHLRDGWVKCDLFQSNGIYKTNFYYVNDSLLKNHFPECKINLSELDTLR